MNGALLTVAIEVPLRDGDVRVGTGYAIGPDLVLTADHVVRPQDEDAGGPRVLPIDPDRAPVPASLVWPRSAESHDVALLRTERRVASDDLSAERVLAASALTESRSAETWGFPLVHRDGVGHDAGAEGFRGTLYAPTPGKPQALEVTGPPDVWDGMSGAPVLVDGRLHAVVCERTRGFSGTRLRTTPVSAFVADPELRALIGLEDIAGAALKRLTEQLRRVPRLSSEVDRKLREKLRVSESSDVAEQLLALPIDRATGALMYVHELHATSADDREVLRQLLSAILPLCVASAEAANTLRSQHDESWRGTCVLDLRYATHTMAEVVMAGVDACECVFLPGSPGEPRGERAISSGPRAKGIDWDGGNRIHDLEQELERRFRDLEGLDGWKARARGRLRTQGKRWRESLTAGETPLMRDRPLYVVIPDLKDSRKSVAEEIHKAWPDLRVVRLVHDPIRCEGGDVGDAEDEMLASEQPIVDDVARILTTEASEESE